MESMTDPGTGQATQGCPTATNSSKVLVEGQELRLHEVQRGVDFIFGLCQDALVAIPMRRVSCIRSGALPNFHELSLLSFLELQRLPVLLEIELGSAKQSCWLLNVVEGWLRITTRFGVEWTPATSLVMAKVGAVENSPRLFAS